MDVLGFGFGDYLFFTPIILIFLISLMNEIKGNKDASSILFLFIILYLIISLPIMYYFNLSDGQYKAKIIEEYGLKVGEGTDASKTFEILKKDDIFIIKRAYLDEEFKLKEKKSWDDNLYIKTYYSVRGDNYLTISRFGYVMIHKKNNEIYSKIKVFD